MSKWSKYDMLFWILSIRKHSTFTQIDVIRFHSRIGKIFLTKHILICIILFSSCIQTHTFQIRLFVRCMLFIKVVKFTLDVQYWFKINHKWFYSIHSYNKNIDMIRFVTDRYFVNPHRINKIIYLVELVVLYMHLFFF